MKIWQISIQALEPSDYYLPEELALLTNQSEVGCLKFDFTQEDEESIRLRY